MFSNRAMTAYRRGCDYHSQECFLEALRYFEEATQHNPNWYAAWFNRGQSLYEMQRFDEAVVCFQKASNCDANQYGSWQAQAASKAILGCHQDALFAIEKALELESNSLLVWATYGTILYRMGRFEDAKRAIQKSLSATLDLNSKTLADTWSLQGIICLELEDYRQAIIASDKAIAYNAKLAEAWNTRGAALNGMGQYIDALESLNQAIKINQNEEVYWFNHSQSWKKLDKPDKAIRSCKKAIEINPGFTVALKEMSRMLFSIKQIDECLEFCQKALSQDRKDVEIISLCIKCFMYFDHRSIALTALDDFSCEINNMNSKDASKLLCLHAHIQYYCENYIEAIDLVKRAVAIDPNNLDLVAMKIIILIKKGNPERCIKSYDQMLSGRELSFDMYYQLGLSFMGAGCDDEAAKVSKDALKFHENNLYLFDLLSSSLYRSKKFAEAIAVCEQTLDSDPERKLSWHTLIFAMVNCDRSNEALDKINQILKSKPNDAKFWGLKGYILSDLKDFDDAILACSKSIILDANTIEAWYSLSRIYAVTKQTDMALQCLREMIERKQSLREMILASDDAYFEDLQSHSEFKRLMQIED